ncbi:serine/threonine-protein phosphatase 7 long form-like protein, partial [Trifolium medium]|nr:serine/threonine-protein phosphatase 7 long form-like protein [Trifolium medium]
TPYEDHRDVCPFEDIALYSGWIRCGTIRVRYLPERMLRQFGYVQTTPHHPDAAANPLSTVTHIDQHWVQHMDRVLTSDMLGTHATRPSDTAPGYMSWYYKISHQHIIPFPAGYPVPLPESDAVADAAV